jgi:hypothetical protein
VSEGTDPAKESWWIQWLGPNVILTVLGLTGTGLLTWVGFLNTDATTPVVWLELEVKPDKAVAGMKRYYFYNPGPNAATDCELIISVGVERDAQGKPLPSPLSITVVGANPADFKLNGVLNWHAAKEKELAPGDFYYVDVACKEPAYSDVSARWSTHGVPETLAEGKRPKLPLVNSRGPLVYGGFTLLAALYLTGFFAIRRDRKLQTELRQAKDRVRQYEEDDELYLRGHDDGFADAQKIAGHPIKKPDAKNFSGPPSE